MTQQIWEESDDPPHLHSNPLSIAKGSGNPYGAAGLVLAVRRGLPGGHGFGLQPFGIYRVDSKLLCLK